jgi:hypothetical protein
MVLSFIGGFCLFMGLAALCIFGILRCLRRKFEGPTPVIRRIVAWSSPVSNAVRLECGHVIGIELHGPSELPCPQCTEEVQRLKQMAGEK